MATVNSSTEQEASIFPFIDNLENYEVIKKIGGGTYGKVYKARCKKTNTFVALKYILIHKEEEGFPRTALCEIDILRSFRHQNIVQIIGMCRSPRNNSFRSDFYLVLEFCDYDLANILKNIGIRFTLEDIRCIMKQILDGLYYLHNNKIIHRDLKPANILLTNNGILKLADFGSSKMMKSSEHDRSKQRTIQIVTLWYRAPELLLGDQNYGLPIDMWSVGCIFAELWSLIPIMQGNDEQHQLGLICKLRGNIEWPGVQNLPFYSELELSQNNDLQIQNYLINYRTYVREPLALDLIDRLLTLDPKQRLDVNQAVKSRFFQPEPSSKNLKLLLLNHSLMLQSNETSHNLH